MPQNQKKNNYKKKSSKKSSGGAFLPSLLATMVIVVAILASYFVYITYLKEPEPEITIPDGSASVHYIDVGQGDSILIENGSEGNPTLEDAMFSFRVVTECDKMAREQLYKPHQ